MRAGSSSTSSWKWTGLWAIHQRIAIRVCGSLDVCKRYLRCIQVRKSAGASPVEARVPVAQTIQARRPATLADRHLVIFVLVLAANAAMSYVYTKDEIMSTAGAFYALPVAGAAVYFLRGWPDRARAWPVTAVVCVLCLAGSAAWATRAAMPAP